LHFAGPAPFPYASPAIFSMPLAFLVIWLVSITDRSAQAQQERALYEDQKIRSETGIGASSTSSY
jgi:cation/acetate symporter